MEELMALLESSDYNKKIQSNGFSKFQSFSQLIKKNFILYFFTVFTNKELNAFLDRSDMVKKAPKTEITESAEHFKVLNKS